MKFLLLAAIALVVYLLWRSARRPSSGGESNRAGPGSPQHMVQCAACAVHLPASDAVPGKLGSYCCVQHRDQKEG